MTWTPPLERPEGAVAGGQAQSWAVATVFSQTLGHSLGLECPHKDAELNPWLLAQQGSAAWGS